MRFIAAFAATLAAAVSVPALAADWHLAETEHFTVYAEDSEKDTREFAQDLERLDEALRVITGVGPSDGSLPESAKVTVFRFGETRDMASLIGAPGSGVAGFFIGRAEGPVAFVPKQQNKRRERGFENTYEGFSTDPKEVLFHEYVHYFMFQHADAPYPLWYSEGFAELFSNVEFEEDRFTIGEVPPDRSPALAQLKIDLQDTFDPPLKQPANEYVGRTYAHGWLIAGHLNLNVERRGQMTKYMQAIAAGKPVMEAAEIAFGDLDELEKELEKARKGRSRLLRVPYATQADPEVSVRRLSGDEEARMGVLIPSKRGVNRDEADKLLKSARSLVEKYPTSAPVLLTALDVEYRAGNYEEAAAIADRTLAADPDNVDAEIYKARIEFARSFEDPSRLENARSLFVKANNKANDHAFPLYGYYMTHLFDDETGEPDGAIAALESAYQYAPFDQGIRQALIYMLLTQDRPAEARILGHRFIEGKAGYSCMLRKQFEQYEEGNKQPLLDEIRPEHPGLYRDEDARKAEREKTEKMIEEYGCKV